MFDVSFGEFALVAIIALLVLGPERLPKAARTLGALTRRARASWQNVKTEIERELAAEDLKKSLRETRDAVDVRTDLARAADDLARNANDLVGTAVGGALPPEARPRRLDAANPAADGDAPPP